MDLIQNSKHAMRIDGPIQIANKNFVSKLDYSDNFEVSFEFKLSTMPTQIYHQILIGKLISLSIDINLRFKC